MKLIQPTFLLIIAGFCIYTIVDIGDYCMHMFSGIILIFWIILYLLIFAAFHIFNDFKKKSNKSINLVTLLMFFIVIISLNIKPRRSSAIIYAENIGVVYPTINISLMADNTFDVYSGGVDGGCYYKGNYMISKDTLTLLRPDILKITDRVISPVYYIDKNKKILYPIDSAKISQDTTRWLKISQQL